MVWSDFFAGGGIGAACLGLWAGWWKAERFRGGGEKLGEMGRKMKSWGVNLLCETGTPTPRGRGR